MLYVAELSWCMSLTLPQSLSCAGHAAMTADTMLSSHVTLLCGQLYQDLEGL